MLLIDKMNHLWQKLHTHTAAYRILVRSNLTHMSSNRSIHPLSIMLNQQDVAYTHNVIRTDIFVHIHTLLNRTGKNLCNKYTLACYSICIATVPVISARSTTIIENTATGGKLCYTAFNTLA